MHRRQFLAAGGAVLAAPLVLRFAHEARAQTLRVRRNLSTIPANDPFFTQYGEAITAMHKLADTDRRSWRGQALIHADFCPHGAAQRPDFILWHRHYITYFERLCGSLIGNPNFSLPYWDWTANNGRLPAPFFTSGGPLNVTTWRDRSDYQADNWGPDRVTTVGQRGINAARGLRDDPRLSGAFTPAAINGILRQSNFSLFQTGVEGNPHNNGHVIAGGVNGHMGDGLSPLDPMFWLHHCNVDRLAAQWQRAGNRLPPPNFTYNGQFVDPSGASQSVTAAQAIDFQSMGFTYDILAEVAVATRGLRVPQESDQTALQGRAITQEPSVIGEGANTQASTLNRATLIPVSTRKIVDNLFTTRTFRPAVPPAAPRLAVEESRILARLNVTDVKGAVRQCVVNVFVNAPDLSPDATSEDPHYAGSFAFFGQHYAHHGGTFLVDVSDALRDQVGQGRLSAENVNIQVVPVLADPSADVQAQFVVSSVELLSV